MIVLKSCAMSSKRQFSSTSWSISMLSDIYFRNIFILRIRIVNIISTSVREPIPNIGLSNTLRGAMASWAKSLSRELPTCITINNVLPGFTDTDRLGSLASSINAKTGKSIEEIHAGWMGQVPIERLIDPLETGAAIAYLCMPISGGIRGVSLAVDGGRMRSI